ncbi:hypothetical protein BDA99DRAFT_540128 [Phascolomyces articulosus]|uniref:Uncharacterized protein n=1 Tax=Phascolomyces articulosus TaxID=60185 RepID=A0AAD5PD19_9FUNG|nr:hypothetical protein BDA99DRAFT_540128 [Phascolomyces articulosus]
MDTNWCSWCDKAVSSFSDSLYCSAECMQSDALAHNPLLGYDFSEYRGFLTTNILERRSSWGDEVQSISSVQSSSSSHSHHHHQHHTMPSLSSSVSSNGSSIYQTTSSHHQHYDDLLASSSSSPPQPSQQHQQKKQNQIQVHHQKSSMPRLNILLEHFSL